MLDVTRADLACHTTLRLGGPAGRLVVAGDQRELVQTVRDARVDGQPVLVLAGGSNVVIADAGFAGTVALVRSTGITVRPDDGDNVLVTVQAGHVWDDVVAFAVGEDLAGLECQSGIPGSAGATPVQNVGAYGQEVSQTIQRVRAYDRRLDQIRELAPADCGFGFRASVFRQSDRLVVLDVTFRLRRSRLSVPIRYPELARQLGVAEAARVPLPEVRQAVLSLRAGKGMVLDPADPDTFSVGSFFLNPAVDADQFAALRARALSAVGAQPPSFAYPGGLVKVSAAWLIERAGFGRGYTGGRRGVGISFKHTLALTNRGTGTTAELLDLAREIRSGVARVFGVELRPEAVLVGCGL